MQNNNYIATNNYLTPRLLCKSNKINVPRSIFLIKTIYECLCDSLQWDKSDAVILVQLEPHIVRKWDNVVSLKSRASCIRRVFTLQLSMRNFAEAYAPPLANYTTLPARLRGQPDDRMVFAPVRNGYNHLTSCDALEIRGN